MAYGLADVITLRQMVEGSEAGEQRKRLEVRKLDAMLGLCELTTCRRRTLLAYFGETRAEPCGNCDNCLVPPEAWDATEAAQKALSCVYRTGQRFGAGYVIDVLLGKDSERIRGFGHQRLSTFGIGADLDVATWRSVFRQLVARGLMSVDVEGFGSLKLTGESRAVLRGACEVRLRRDAAAPRKQKRRREPAERAAGAARATLAPEHRGLFDALRARRRELAKAQGVPPYVIFHDVTLEAMAEQPAAHPRRVRRASRRRGEEARTLCGDVHRGDRRPRLSAAGRRHAAPARPNDLRRRPPCLPVYAGQRPVGDVLPG